MIARRLVHSARARARSALQLACCVLLMSAAARPLAWAESGEDPASPSASVEGTISSIALSTLQAQHVAYVSGNIDYIGYRAPNLAMLDLTSGVPLPAFPWTDSTVNAVIPDGNGGWWVGGNFGHVGNNAFPETATNYLFNVSSTNVITPVNAGFNGQIYSLALNGTTLYVGGSFTLVDNLTRNYACAINVGSSNFGSLVPTWDANCNSPVYQMVVAGLAGSQQLWMMGSFNSVGGNSRQYLCAVSLVDGTVGSFWNMEMDGFTNCYQLVGTDLYLGCNGGSDVGYRKTGLASFTPSGAGANQPLSSFPTTDGQIYCCITDATTGWYIGGNFAHVGAVAVSNLAHLLVDGTVDTGFLPNPDSTVRALLLSGGVLYVGGNFGHINGQARSYAAAIDPSAGTASTTWIPNPDNQVNTIEMINGEVWLGGNFGRIGGRFRSNLAEVDPTSGLATTWNLVPNTPVTSIISDGNALFFSGSHYYGSYYTGYYIPNLSGLSTTNGALVPSFPSTNGQVYSVVADGSGGWYVGGNFSEIGNQNFSNLAHVNSDFSIDTTFTPQPNSTVTALATDLTAPTPVLYVGGNFSQIGGAARTALAALNLSVLSNGQATSWSPGVSGGTSINAIAINTDHTVFVGGSFTQIGGSSITNLAQISNLNGLATSTWNPAPNSTVDSLVIASGRLFVGGGYSAMANAIGGQGYLSSFTLSPLSLTCDTWSARVNSTVLSMAISNDGLSLYLGGYFGQIGGISESYAGEIPISGATPAATAWAPAPSYAVYSIAVTPSTVYLGGNFSTLQSVSHPYLGAVDPSTGAYATSFIDPLLSNVVNSVAVSGSTLGIGGSFSYSDAQTFYGVEALDLTTVQPLAGWTCPSIDGSIVDDLTLSSDSTPELFLSGDFNNVGSSQRTGIAKLVAGTGAVDSTFDAGVDKRVDTMTVSGSTLYFGSYGSTIAAGQSRLNAGAVDQATGATATAFDPHTNNTVRCITPSQSGNTLLVGGDFNFLGWSSRSGAVEIDTVSGRCLPWNPNVGGTVYGMAVDGTNLIVGGYFFSIGGIGRNYIGSVDLNSAALQSWAPLLNSTVNALTATPGTVYASGSFTTVGPASRIGIAAIDDSTALVTAWNPGCRYGSSIHNLTLDGADIIVSGGMDWFGGGPLNGMAAVNLDTGAPEPWAPTTNGNVNCLVCDQTNDIVYVGGSYSTVNGQTRNNLAAIEGVNQSSPGTVSTWNAPINGTVNSLLFQGGSTPSLFVGGTYTNATGVNRTDLSQILISSGIATSWTPNPDGPVYGMTLSGSVLYTGGNFQNINLTTATPRSRLAAYDFSTSAGTLTAWNPDANNAVYSLLVDGGTIYAGGTFNTMGGQSQNYVAAIDASGNVVTTWNPAVNSYVYALAPGNQDVVVGGTFYNINGYTNNQYLSSINPSSATAFGNWPLANNAVYALQRYNNTIVAGGSFNTMISYNTGATFLTSAFALVPLVQVTTTGDVNGDSKVDQTDLDIVLSHFGYRISDPGWLAEADVNGDGVVNIDDVNLVLANWNP